MAAPRIPSTRARRVSKIICNRDNMKLWEDQCNMMLTLFGIGPSGLSSAFR